jgi:hypothetical protein
MDADVDEEDDQPMEQSYFEYKMPTSIDFSTVGPEDRERNYEPYGGGQMKVDSPERQIQENREATTLIAHYMFKTDIPPCPREPSDPYTGENHESKAFGTPDDANIVRRLARFQPPAPNVDVTALLQNLYQPQPNPTPVVDPSAAALQSILASMTNQYAQQPTYVPPAPPAPPEPQDTPMANDISSILAALGGGAPQPATSAPVQQAYAPIAAPQVPDLAALFAQFAAQGQQGAPPVPPNFQYSQYQPGGEHYEDPERKRMRETEQEGGVQYDQYDNYNDEGGNSKRQKFNKNVGVREDKKFSQACKFYAEGKCRKGAACTYRHD